MNTYYVASIPYSDSLYHFGIKGQKWGVRNGPPYPLKENDYSKSEKSVRVGTGKMGIDPVTTYVAAVVLTYTINNVYQKLKRKQFYEKNKEKLEKEIESIHELKYSDIDHVYNSKTQKYIDDRENKRIDIKTGLKIKDHEMTADEDMALVNPEYKTYGYAKVNCGLCTAAYDIRRRGYDVIAGYADDGIGPAYYNKFYPGSKRNDLAGDYIKGSLVIGKRVTRDDCIRALTQIGKDKNSRGAIFVVWNGVSSGHAMAYDVDANGDVTIRDTQSNKLYTGDKAIKLLKSTSYIGNVRLDNVEPDIEVMKKEGVIR